MKSLSKRSIMNESMNKLTIPDEIITNQIYLIRGKKVMLDMDLASLYNIETKVLKQAVRRNPDRFPEDFMFELNQEEFEHLRSQIVTSSWGGTRYPPMAFTEQGVAMLSSVLNSKEAIRVNIQIMRIFTRIREILSDNLSIRLEVESIKKKLSNQDKNIETIFAYLDELISRKGNPRPRIGYRRASEKD